MNVPHHPYVPDNERRQVILPPEPPPPVLTPAGAWRLLKKRTSASISRANFYRWLHSGKVFCYRVGYHFYIPLAEIDNIVKQCREGKWF